MVKCPNCGSENVEGVFYCEDCGTPLLIRQGNTTLLMSSSTRKLSSIIENAAEPATATASPKNGADAIPHLPSNAGEALWEPKNLKPNTTIILQFLAHQQARMELPVQDVVVIGRSDERTQFNPDADLTPHGAVESGVSRRHATFTRRDTTLLLIDEGSANGTFVNGQRVIPKEPRIVRDGDEVRFGKLTTRVLFK